MRLPCSRIAEKVVFLYIAHFEYIAHGHSARYIASRLYSDLADESGHIAAMAPIPNAG